MRSQIVCLALIAASLAACATTQVTPSGALRGGVYALRAYGGKPIPADLGTLPPKGAPGDTIPRNLWELKCHILVTGGELRLDMETLRYSLWYELRHGCTRRVLSKSEVDGTFEQHGSDLVFHIHVVDGDRTFRGSVGQSSITVDIGSLLEFRR